MNIVIRTDASAEIGTGHVMRCLTLAKKLKLHGADVTFICRKLEGDCIEYLKVKDTKVITLPSILTEDSDFIWTKFNWNTDAEETLTSLKNIDAVDLLIVDHYALDKKWESSLRNHVKYIMVIDDLANRIHDCDILMDSTFGRDEKEYSTLYPENAVGLFGVKYALLREQFLKFRKKKFFLNNNCINMHLFFGGRDPLNYTVKFSRIILENFPNININAIIGDEFDFIVELDELELEYINRFQYKQSVENMAIEMFRCDLAIGAPGTATWERACVGIPSIYLTTNNNQIDIMNILHNKGLAIYLGEANTINTNEFIRKMKTVISSPDLLNSLFYNSILSVDGLGVERLTKILHEKIEDRL